MLRSSKAGFESQGLGVVCLEEDSACCACGFCLVLCFRRTALSRVGPANPGGRAERGRSCHFEALSPPHLGWVKGAWCWQGRAWVVRLPPVGIQRRVQLRVRSRCRSLTPSSWRRKPLARHRGQGHPAVTGVSPACLALVLQHVFFKIGHC